MIKRALVSRQTYSWERTRPLLALLFVALLLAMPASPVGAAPLARFAVSPTEPPEHMWGDGWLPNASIQIDVDDPITPQNPDFTRTVESDDAGAFAVYDLAFDLAAGQDVTVGDGITKKGHTVLPLAIDGYEVDTDQIWGFGEPNSSVTVLAVEDQTGTSSERNVSTGPLGGWTVDFSSAGPMPWEPALDVGPGTFVFAYQRDDDEDQTQVDFRVPSPKLGVNPRDDSVSGWEWPASASVNIEIDDPGTAQNPDYETVVECDTEGNFWLDSIGFDIKAGHTAIAGDGATKKDLVVTPLELTAADPGTDVVSGMAASGSEVWVHVWDDDDPRRLVVASVTGVWAADFATPAGSEPGEGIYDIVRGTEGIAYEEDGDGDQTQVPWTVPKPQFGVDPNEDRVSGWEWPAGGRVDVTVDDPSTVQSPDFGRVVDCDENGSFDLSDAGFDFSPGQLVTVADRVTTKEHVVKKIGVSGVDPDTDVIWGRADPNTFVRVEAFAEGGAQRIVQADGLGAWLADFSVEAGPEPQQQAYDIVPGSEGNVCQEDDDGDQTQVNWRVANPVFAAYPAQEAIEGWDWPAFAEVTITVDDPGTPAPSDLSMTATCNEFGEFWVELPGFDLRGSQLVAVTDGASTKQHEVTALIVGSVDEAADTVSGLAKPGSEVWVRAQADGEEDAERLVYADASGEWTADFSEEQGPEPSQRAYDIGPGAMGAANQTDDDGDRTQEFWRAANPVFRVNAGYDAVAGEEWPASIEVAITIDDPDTALSPDYEMTAPTDADGVFSANAMWFDIVPGHQVTVSYGMTSKFHEVRAVGATSVDVTADTVSGTAEPFSDVWVGIYDDSGIGRQVQAGPSGAWTADFSVASGGEEWQQPYDLIVGTQGSANQSDEDNDETWTDWLAETTLVASDDQYETHSETTLQLAAPGVLANDTYEPGVTIDVLTQPSHGVLVLNSATGAFSYVPDRFYEGGDSFTYRLLDGSMSSGPATVTIVVTGPNSPPVAVDNFYSVDEDGVLNVPAPGVLGNDTDAEGDGLTAVQMTSPAYGAVTLNPDGSLTYVPGTDLNGEDQFHYQAFDGVDYSTPGANIYITIVPVNDPPTNITLSDSVIAEHQPAGTTIGSLWTTDVDNESDYEYALVPGAGSGDNASFTIVDDELRSATALDYEVKNSHSVRIRTTDAGGLSVEKAFTISVTDVNEAPKDITLVGADVNENQPVGTAVGTLSTADPDSGGTFTYTLVSGTGGGDNASFSISGSSLRTAASFDFETKDAYDIRVRSTDPGGLYYEKAFAISVRDVNESPVTADDDYAVAENQILVVDAAAGVLANDWDPDAGDVLGSATTLSEPSFGTLVLQADGSFTYEPDAGFTGSDSFAYKVSDGKGGVGTATARITVTPTNDPPVAVSDVFTLPEDDPGFYSGSRGVVANDTDANLDYLEAYLDVGPSHGVLTYFWAEGDFIYVPDADFSGVDSFTYRAWDGLEFSLPATVTLNVTAENDPPTAIAISSSAVAEHLPSGTTVGTLSTVDPDVGDVHSYALVPGSGSTDNASFWIDGGALKTAASFDFEAKNSYSVRVRSTDSGELVCYRALTITVENVNEAPTVTDDSYTVPEDGALTAPSGTGVLANDSDLDGDPIVAVKSVDVSHGVLSLGADGSFSYQPAANYNGSDTFTYTVSDGKGGSNTGTARITVTPVNDAPVGAAESASTAQDTPLSVGVPGVLGNDSDVDADALTAQLVSGPAHGTLGLNSNGSYSYVPHGGWSGVDSFIYRAFDGAAFSNPVVVTITVTAVVQPPPPPPAPTVRVTTPSKVKRSKAFYISGAITPTHAVSSTTVTLSIQRYYKRKWRVVKRATVAGAVGTGAYRYRVKLSPKGSWRVVATHAVDAEHTGAATATRKFTVK